MPIGPTGNPNTYTIGAGGKLVGKPVGMDKKLVEVSLINDVDT